MKLNIKFKAINLKGLYKRLSVACLVCGVSLGSFAQSISPHRTFEPDTLVYSTEDGSQENISVAYGTATKEGLTAAISSVSADEMRKTFTPSLSNTLFGRLPGLTVTHGSGEPGFDEPSLLIRGIGTLNDAAPLVMVDGFEASFDNLSVGEIESVSVLKDAAALALYGIRGANGVILVTTKRGKEGKTQIRLDARTGFQQPTRLPEFVNAHQYASLYNEARSNDGLPLRYSPEQLEAYRTGSDPYLYPDVNWTDEVLQQTARITDYNLTFSGGGKTTRYFILLGYLQNEGLYANTDRQRKENSNANFSRINFRSNIDVAISPKVSAALDFGGRIEDRFYPNFDGPSLWENMARYPASAFPVTNPDGSWGGSSIYPDNPVASVLGRGYTSSHDRNILTNLRLSEDLSDFVPGLRFSQALGINNWHRGNYNRTRNLAYYELYQGPGDSDINYLQRGLDTGFGVAEGGNDQWNRMNVQAALDYEKQLGENGISAMLMYHQDVLHTGGNNVPYARQSIMGRVKYNHQAKYYAELGFAYSGSERFAEGERFGFFPSLSGAWIVSKESFLENSTAISFLKARASAGLVGSDLFGGSRFAYAQDFYYSGNYRLGMDNSAISTIVEGALANPGVTWEKDLKFNLGFEGQLYQKLNFGMDFFYNTRTDVLVDGENIYPNYLGAVSPFENVGKVNNRGFEIDLLYQDQLGSLEYFIGASAFFSKNKIVDMNEMYRPEGYMYRTGHPVGQQFGLEAIGFYSPEDFDANGELVGGIPPSSFAPVQPGDIRYSDKNNDGKIDQNDEHAIGKPWQPEMTYTFSLGGRFKGFDLELFFYGLANRDVYLNGTYFWALQNDANIGVNALNRWTPENQQNATFPRLTTLPNENNFRPSTFWMKSGNVFRLRNVELGYTLPVTLTERIKVDNVRVFANAVNLISWDKMEMLDPESFGGYPPLKSLNMGVSVQF